MLRSVDMFQNETGAQDIPGGPHAASAAFAFLPFVHLAAFSMS